MATRITGCARTERESAQGKLVFELKTLNHRYLEISIRLPESLRFAEATIRSELQKTLSRGKGALSLLWQSHAGRESNAQLNPLVLTVLTEQMREQIQNIE